MKIVLIMEQCFYRQRKIQRKSLGHIIDTSLAVTDPGFP